MIPPHDGAAGIARSLAHPPTHSRNVAADMGIGRPLSFCPPFPAWTTNYTQVVSEIRGASVFLMKLVPNAHHLEVQVLADEYGDAIALHSRDCSVQRRHQKIIEEVRNQSTLTRYFTCASELTAIKSPSSHLCALQGPVVVANEQILQEMEQGAVRLARAVGYSGVGTVEYLYADGHYYFLELNPRLQVEHPVTEQITQALPLSSPRNIARKSLSARPVPR